MALLVVLFYLIGKAADVVIGNVKVLSIKLGISQFWLGLILGILTSMPELTVGVQAALQNVGQLSFGNLMGGVVVLLGLIVGVSVVVDRGIDVTVSFKHRELIIICAYISLPLWLMFDGVLSVYDGLFLLVSYGLAVFYFIRSNSAPHSVLKSEEGTTSKLKAFGHAIFGIAAVVALAKFILDLTIPLLQEFGIKPFLAGLIFFSLGTNLPELTLAFRSWKNSARDLSFGNLVGSAFANPLIVGLLASIKPISLVIGLDYYVFVIIVALLLVSFVGLAYTGRRLTVREGWILLGWYVIFLVSQVGLK
jgi:cation:H+ antiporter